MYFSFDSKDKGSFYISTWKFIRFPLKLYAFYLTARLFCLNTPINGRFSIFLYLFTIGARYDFAYLCQESYPFLQKTTNV